MSPDTLKSLAAALAKSGAPILGGALGGPAGAAIAGVVIGALSDALGVEPTPEAVQAKIEADTGAAVVVQRVEAAQSDAIRDLELRLADTANARAAQIEYVRADSPTQWAPVIVTAIVLTGFAVLSWLAMRAAPGSSERDVVLFLLGAWLSLATASVNFWLGSSAASKSKDATLATLARSPTTQTVIQPKATTANVSTRK